MQRQTYDIEDIKTMLLAQCEAVVARYAPPAQGSHTTMGKYYTLNPGRADRSVGSFVIQMSGARAGRWNDFATGERGDLIDLIGLALNVDTKAALREARGFLGLENESPADVARRKAATERAKKLRGQAAQKDREDAARRSRQALAIWLSGQERLRGTPVEYYLRDSRGIDLAQLGRQPRALRYVPKCQYYDQDPETGEVFDAPLPAMAALITDLHGNTVAVHRTYLALDKCGQWGKAQVPRAKKVLGPYAGAAINIWSGAGPRGGKGSSLPTCAPGAHVYIAEGIEDALSVVMLDPDVRVLAAISLSNLGAVKLPKNVSRVTLVADMDESAEAQEALRRAVAHHRNAGRDVRMFQNRWGGKDLNDALRTAHSADRSPAGQGDLKNRRCPAGVSPCETTRGEAVEKTGAAP